MAKEFVIKHGLIVHGEITGSDVRIDDWNSVSASLAELNSNVGEAVTTASIVGNVITFTKSDGTTFETVVQEDTGSFFTSASVDLNTITFHYGDNTSGSLSVETGTTLIRVKNTSGGAISKGTPVYITGNVGATDMLQIAPADASDASKMPAVGLLLTDLGINGEGFVVQGGYLTGMVTDTIDGTSTTSNDTVYVKAGGGLTMTKPTGDTNYIQNIAKVARVHGTAGSLIVSSILRTNDVPNLPTGKIWVGDGNTVTSSFVHLDETNQRMGIGTDTPLKPLHIDNESVPIRLESDTHNAVVVNYRTDEVGTGNGIQVGARGKSDFFVQQDIVTGGSSQWNVNVYVSQSGKVYLPNLDGGLDDQILYYNNETGELIPGPLPSTGSFFTSASVDYNRVTFTSGDGTTATITIDTGSFEPDRQDTGSFFTSASVDLNRITFTQGDGTTEVVTVHTGSKATPAGTTTELQFKDTGSFGATTGITYTSNPQRLDFDTTSILIEGKSVPIQLTEGSSTSKQTVISYAQSTTNNVGFRVGNNDLGDTGRDIFVIAHGTSNWNPSNTTNIFELDQAGSLIMSAYGSGNITGTATRYLAVDADGSLIEESIPSQGDTGSFYVSSSVDQNRITFTQGDGTTEVVTVGTGSAVTTDISALNTFTGSIQTEVDNLKAATGSYYVSSSRDQDNLRLFQADGTSVSHDLYDPRNYVSSSVDLNRITFTQRDGTTEVVTVHTGSGLTGNGSTGQIALWDSTKRLNGDSHLVWNPLSNRMGINIASPLSQIHIDGYGQPIRLTSTSNTQMYIRYQNQYSTSEGIRVGNDSTNNTGGGGSDYGADNFVVQWDSGNPSSNSWQEMFRVSSSGEMYAQNLPSSTTSNTLYYNTTTGEVTYGSAPSGGGTVNTGSFYVSSSVDLNRITFTQGDGTTEVVTVHTGSGGTTPPAGSDRQLQFNDAGSFGASQYLTYNGKRLEIDSQNSGPALRLSASLNDAVNINFRAQNTVNNGIQVGSRGANNFFIQQDSTANNDASNWNVNLFVSQSGEMFAENLATATTSNTLYYNTTTGEITYGTAPGGGSGIALTDLSVEIGSLSPSGSLSYNDSTGVFTFNPATISGGGGSGTVNTGVAGYLAYYPSNGTTVDDTSNLYWNSSNSRLGIGTTNPESALHIEGQGQPIRLTSSTNTQMLIRAKNSNSTSEGIRIGNDSTSPLSGDNFVVQWDSGVGGANNWGEIFRVSGSGEMFAANLATATTSNTLYYNTTTKEITYGAAPSGGSGETYDLNATQASTDVNLNLTSTSGTDDSNITLTAGNNITLTRNSATRVTIDASGGGGSPGGSDTHVQFNDGGSFGGSADLRFDSTAKRLGINVPSADTIEAALHIDGFGIPIQLSGAGSAWVRARTSSTPTGQSGIRFGAAGGGAVDEFTVQRNVGGTTWSEVFSVENNGVTNIANTLRVNGGAYIGGTTNPSSGKLQVNGDLSGVSVYASHDIVAYSDARSKVNVETIPNALEKVNAVRGVTYNKVEDPEGIRYMGVIAQELLEHLPEVVRESEAGDYSVAYGNVVGVLIEAVKELTAKVEDLESRLGK